MDDEKKLSTAAKKQAVLDYLAGHDCTILEALKQTGVCGANNFYKWKKRDAEFAAKVDAIKDRDVFWVDMAEDGLYRLLKKDNWKAIQYVLDTKGRGHDWDNTSKQVIEVEHRAIAQIEMSIPEDKLAQITAGSGQMIATNEADVLRLTQDFMEAKGEEMVFDADRDE